MEEAHQASENTEVAIKISCLGSHRLHTLLGNLNLSGFSPTSPGSHNASLVHAVCLLNACCRLLQQPRLFRLVLCFRPPQGRCSLLDATACNTCWLVSIQVKGTDCKLPWGQCCPSMSSHPQSLRTSAWLTDACASVETPAMLLVLCVVTAVDLWMIQSIALEGSTQSSYDGRQRAALLQSSPSVQPTFV